MNPKKKLLLCIYLGLLIIINGGYKTGDEKEKIYNDNDKIAQEENNFSFIKRECKEESNEKLDMEYNIFSGTNNIWVIQSKDKGEITFDYNSKVNKGEFKAVLVHPNKEVENIFEGTGENSKTIKLNKGKYVFKIVGKKSKGKLIISNRKNENVNVRQSRIF